MIDWEQAEVAVGIVETAVAVVVVVVKPDPKLTSKTRRAGNSYLELKAPTEMIFLIEVPLLRWHPSLRGP